MPHPSRESSSLKLNVLTITQQARHNTQAHPGSWSLLWGGERHKKLNSFFCHLQASSQYFQYLTITKSRKNKYGQWHHNNAIGMLQKKAGKKGKLIPPGNTGIAQGCNKARRTLGQVRLQRHIMCSTQSRNKCAILNIFQVYFQKKKNQEWKWK